MTHCYSCGAGVKEASPKDKVYCEYCLDEDKQLKSREEVKKGIAGWLSAWAVGKLEEDEASRRAELYMQSMPEWAEK